MFSLNNQIKEKNIYLIRNQAQIYRWAEVIYIISNADDLIIS